MKTIKLTAGMPLGVKYITMDLSAQRSDAWYKNPVFLKSVGSWHSNREGDYAIRVFIGDALKPGEIAKVVP